MSIRRTRLLFDNYAQVPNAWMRDTRLSRKARGLLAELLTHRVGWEITLESLVAGGPEGRDAVRSAIKELERCGYLERQRARREDGTFSGANYELREPTSDNPTQDEPPLKKTISQKTMSQEDQKHGKPTRTASGRAMSPGQLTMLMDLVLMQEHDETDPEGYVRRLVSTYDEADHLIKDYWREVEHIGRANIASDAHEDPSVYARLSPKGQAFVDREDIRPWV